MKKVEVYLSNQDYDSFMEAMMKYQKCVIDHQDDGAYTDQERTEIINTLGSVPFYVGKGIKKQLDEMMAYVNKYESGSEKNKKADVKMSEKKEVQVTEEPDFPENIEYQIEDSSAEDFDINNY